MLTIHPRKTISKISPFMVCERHARVFTVYSPRTLSVFAATLEIDALSLFFSRLPAALLFNKQAREPVARQSAFFCAPPTDGMQLYIHVFRVEKDDRLAPLWASLSLSGLLHRSRCGGGAWCTLRWRDRRSREKEMRPPPRSSEIRKICLLVSHSAGHASSGEMWESWAEIRKWDCRDAMAMEEKPLNFVWVTHVGATTRFSSFWRRVLQSIKQKVYIIKSESMIWRDCHHFFPLLCTTMWVISHA